MSIAGIGTYITPRETDGDELTTTKRRGMYTLAANTTYLFVFGGATAPYQHVQLTGYTAGAVVTSATIQTCSQGVREVSDTSTVVGEWIDEDPTDAFVAVDGTGWTQSNGIAAANGTGVGGASWQLVRWAPSRSRLKVVVGGTGGDFVVAWHGKE